MIATSRTGSPCGAAFHKIGLVLAFLLLMTVTVFAQTQSNDGWDDEDDEDEPTEEKALVDDRPAKKEEVTIRLNEELFVWKDDLTIHRDDTLTISVRDLAPGSRVEILADKGGINLARKIFYSNNKGELDLEIRIGNKKMKGNITLNYTPSGAAKKERSIHLVVD
jgi:hypothetical protein